MSEGWRIRRKTTPGEVRAIPTATLLKYLQDGGLGEGYDYLPPNSATWGTAANALQQLTTLPSAPPPPAPLPPIPPPAPAAPRGRAPGATAASSQAIPPAIPAPPRPTPVTAPMPLAPLEPRGPRIQEPVAKTELLQTAPLAPLPPPPPPSVRQSWQQDPRAQTSHAPARAAEPQLRTATPQPAATFIPRPQAANSPQSETDDSARPRYKSNAGGDEEEELDMTPMIDVTFLLLIFFMVASTISQAASMELPESVTGDTEDPQQRVVLMLEFPETNNAADDKHFVGGRPLLMTEAKFSLKGVEDPIPADELAQRLAEHLREKDKTELILQADRKIPAGVVREVLKIANKAGAKKTLVGVSVKP